MSRLAKGLDILLSGSVERKSPAVSNELPHQPDMNPIAGNNLVPPAELSGLPLAYALYEAEGGELIGSPDSAFAYFCEKTKTIIVVSENDNCISYEPLKRLMTINVMEVAKSEGASFFVHGNEIICNIRGFSESGASYGEAALRALLAYTREQQASSNPSWG